jgi:hypothetical protein
VGQAAKAGEQQGGECPPRAGGMRLKEGWHGECLSNGLAWGGGQHIAGPSCHPRRRSRHGAVPGAVSCNQKM